MIWHGFDRDMRVIEVRMKKKQRKEIANEEGGDGVGEEKKGITRTSVLCYIYTSVFCYI